MKKIILFAIGLLTSVTIQAQGFSFEYKGVTMTYEVSGSNAILKNGPTTSATVVEIPVTVEDSEHNSFTVTSIAQDAFLNNTDVNEVIISANITVIEKTAFKGCSQLKKITLPATLGTIGQDAFNGCSRLAHIWCKVASPTSLSPANLPSLSTTNMVTLYVSDKEAYENDENWSAKFVNETFGNRIFRGEMRTVRHKNMWYVCASESKVATLNTGKNETEIIIPDADIITDDEGVEYKVTGIDKSAFNGYSVIRRLTIPEDVTVIGLDAFKNCSSLTHVYCKVSDPALLSPANLPSNDVMTLYVDQDKSESYLGNDSWSNKFKNRVYEGEMLLIPDDDGMWYICAADSKQATLYTGKNDVNIIIPEKFQNNKYTVTGIDRNAFNGSSSIVSLTIPATVTAIGKDAFKNCGNLAYVYSKSTIPYTIDNNVFSNKAKAILYTPVTYQGIEGVTGWSGFLREERCDDMEVFSTNDGMTYVGWTNGNTKEAILTIGISGTDDFTIPLKVTSPNKSVKYNVISIGDNAFSGVGSFKNLTISDNVKTIGANAFKGRTAMETITFSSNLTTIGANAFQGCTGLKLITLPATLTSIGEKAFNGCNNLVEIENNMSPTIAFSSSVFPDDNIILYVPSNKTTYEDNGWNNNNFLHVFQGARQEDNTDPNLTYVYTSDNEAVLLTSNANNTASVSIAKTIQTDKTVTAIAKNAFLNNSLLESITFQDGCSIATIGKYAFKNCSKLDGITLPTSLRTIGEYAFENNTALTSIVIPDGTLTIRQYAFKKCSNLTTVTLAASLTSIEDYAFDQCVSITTINSKIPGDENHLFALKDHVFSPYIVPTIYVDNGLAYYQGKEGWIKYKNYLKPGTKDTYEFEGDIKLKYEYYTGGEDATLIQVTANSTNTINIPDVITINSNNYKVTAIGDNAFDNVQNKTNITSITIGTNIKTIGANAFKGFTGITSVTLPAAITAISRSAFEGCASLQSVTFTKKTNNEYSINTIGAYAFKGCINLNISLPASLISIGDYAFENNNAKLISLSIPNNVKSIGIGAFKGCSKLESVTLPTSLESIGDNAFENCNNTNFTSIEIPEGTETIGVGAFKNCSKLTTLTLPSTLNKIEVYAFDGCSSLTTITSKIEKDSLFEIDETVFPQAVYSAATVYVPIYVKPDPDPNADPNAEPDPEIEKTTEDKYRETKGWKNFLKYIEGELKETTVGIMRYEYLTGKKTATLIATTLTSELTVTIDAKVTIDDVEYDVKAIGDNAFSSNVNTKNITKLIISEGIETIGVNAFKDCNKLTKIELPSSLKVMDNGAFQNCSGLVELEFPSDLRTIGNNAFKGCSNLIEVDLPSNLVSLGESAFESCTNLKKVWLYGKLTSIGNYAFKNCNKITHVCSKIYNPFAINEDVFSLAANNNTATLFVPIGQEGNYTGNWISRISNKVGGEFVGEYLGSAGDEKDMTFSCYTKENESLAILTSSSTTSQKVTIPTTITPGGTIAEDSYTVAVIGKNAFQGRTAMKLVKLASGIISIGDNAFAGCTGLTEVDSKIPTPFQIQKNLIFPENVNTLYVPGGEDLKNLYVTAGWVFSQTNMGSRVEYTDDNKITYLYAENEPTATIIMSDASNTNSVIPAAVPKTNKIVIAIAESAFSGNTRLDSLKLPEGLEKIGANAFNGCTGIKYVVLPSTLTAIGADAFKGCTKLTDVDSRIQTPFDITNKSTIFPDNAVSLYVPQGKTAVYNSNNWIFTNTYEGERIEHKISYLTYVYSKYGSTATIIKSDVTNTNPVVPAIVPGITVPNSQNPVAVVTIAESAFSGNTRLDSLKLPEGLEKIGANAFYGCTGIKYVILPSTLTTIGDDAFKDCTKLTDVDSRKDSPIDITSRKSSIFPSSAVSLYVPHNKMEAYHDAGWVDFTIHNGKRIENKKDNITYLYAEYETNASIIKSETETVVLELHTNVPSVTVPNTTDSVKVTAIVESAFSGNTKLESLKLPEGLVTIGANAFQKCYALKKIWLPKTLTEIGQKAFDGCGNIAYICVKNSTPPAANNNSFSAYKATLFVPKETDITAYENNDVWNQFPIKKTGLFVDTYNKDNITYECVVTGEGEAAKSIAILLMSTTTSTNPAIPETVELNSLAYSVTSIADSAFMNNTKLANLIIPKTITSIGEKAFNGCTSLSVIESKMTSPLDIKNKNVFSDYSATLYIPTNSTVRDYNDNGWNFSNIFIGERKEETIDGFTYIYSTGDQKAVLTKSTASSKDLKVPGSFKIGDATYKVIAIDKSVFKGNKNIVNLTISDNIEVIRAGAFQNCTNLKKVILPSTLKEIGDNAFDGCEAIGYISTKGGTPSALGNSVFATSIKAAAKLYVPAGGAISVYKESGWKSYIDNILEGELKEVTANDLTYYCVVGPNTATLVKASTSKAEVTIEGTVKDGGTTFKVTEVGSDAFSGNSKLAKVTINDDISIIGKGAFQNCANLKEVVIPASMTAINDNAFNKCDRLALVVSKMQKPCAVSDNVFPSVSAKLNIPSGTKGLYVEKGWDKYFSIILEGDVLEAKVDSMTYLYVTGSKTATLMKGTPKEKEVTIPTTVTINGTAYSVTSIEESALANASSIEILTISEGIETIGASAFKNCSNLKQLFLPSSINKIGDNAFVNCKNLIQIQSSIKAPFAISDNVFNTASYDFGTLYVPVGTSKQYANSLGWKNFNSVLEGNMSEVTIEGMTYICVSNPDADKKTAKLIKGLDKTKEVKIPAKIYTGGVSYKVVGVEKSAFYGYGTLEKVIVSEGIKTIGVTAFKNCSKLNTVVLPDSLESIGDNAFDGCSKLESVTCGSEKPLDISDNVFSVTALNVNVPTEAAVEAYKKHAVWKQFNILYSMSSISEGEDTEEVDAGTYQITTVEGENSSITTVAIVDDDNVTGAFTIPETVTLNGKSYDVSVIAPSTFLNNKNLISVSIPSTIIAIGEAAFAGCSNLHSIIVNIEEPINLSAPAAVRGMMTRSGGSSVFEGVDTETCILYVPEGSIGKYKAADVWREFKNVLAIPATGISGIVITDGTPFDVYNMQGRKVKSGVTTLKGLAPGVYIVNGKKLVHK